jgi:membrane protein implicated in regulation of membrane protease activity
MTNYQASVIFMAHALALGLMLVMGNVLWMLATGADVVHVSAPYGEAPWELGAFAVLFVLIAVSLVQHVRRSLSLNQGKSEELRRR